MSVLTSNVSKYGNQLNFDGLRNVDPNWSTFLKTYGAWLSYDSVLQTSALSQNIYYRSIALKPNEIYKIEFDSSCKSFRCTLNLLDDDVLRSNIIHFPAYEAFTTNAMAPGFFYSYNTKIIADHIKDSTLEGTVTAVSNPLWSTFANTYAVQSSNFQILRKFDIPYSGQYYIEYQKAKSVDGTHQNGVKFTSPGYQSFVIDNGPFWQNVNQLSNEIVDNVGNPGAAWYQDGNNTYPGNFTFNFGYRSLTDTFGNPAVYRTLDKADPYRIPIKLLRGHTNFRFFGINHPFAWVLKDQNDNVVFSLRDVLNYNIPNGKKEKFFSIEEFGSDIKNLNLIIQLSNNSGNVGAFAYRITDSLGFEVASSSLDRLKYSSTIAETEGKTSTEKVFANYHFTDDYERDAILLDDVNMRLDTISLNLYGLSGKSFNTEKNRNTADLTGTKSNIVGSIISTSTAAASIFGTIATLGASNSASVNSAVNNSRSVQIGMSSSTSNSTSTSNFRANYIGNSSSFSTVNLNALGSQIETVRATSRQNGNSSSSSKVNLNAVGSQIESLTATGSFFSSLDDIVEFNKNYTVLSKEDLQKNISLFKLRYGPSIFLHTQNISGSVTAIHPSTLLRDNSVSVSQRIVYPSSVFTSLPQQTYTIQRKFINTNSSPVTIEYSTGCSVIILLNGVPVAQSTCTASDKTPYTTIKTASIPLGIPIGLNTIEVVLQTQKIITDVKIEAGASTTKEDVSVALRLKYTSGVVFFNLVDVLRQQSTVYSVLNANSSQIGSSVSSSNSTSILNGFANLIGSSVSFANVGEAQMKWLGTIFGESEGTSKVKGKPLTTAFITGVSTARSKAAAEFENIYQNVTKTSGYSKSVSNVQSFSSSFKIELIDGVSSSTTAVDGVIVALNYKDMIGYSNSVSRSEAIILKVSEGTGYSIDSESTVTGFITTI